MSNSEFWGILMDTLSTVLASAAIFLYIFFWVKDKTSANYDVFDSLYLDLLKTGMDNPSFRNKEKTNVYKDSFNGDELIKYEIYAFMTWNFIETIYDKSDEELMKTWGPAICFEAALHINWLNDPENQLKFKGELTEFSKTLISKV